MANVSSIEVSLIKYITDFKQKAVKAINEVTEARVKKLQELSPVDTWDYIRSHTRAVAKIIWSKVTGSNTNTSKNAFWVEFWFRQSNVNRHKKQYDGQPYSSRPVIFNWEWASVYTRVSKDGKLVNDIYKRILK